MASSSTRTPDRTGTRPPRAVASFHTPVRTQSRRWLPLAYLLPAFLVYAAFLLYPLGRSVHLSLYEWDGLTLGTFVGAKNYRDILADAELRAAFGHALVLLFFFSIVPVLLGLPLATVLSRGRVRGRGVVRTIVFLPQVVTMVVVAVAWRRIYSPDGPLNAALSAIGWDGLARGWLGDYTFALPAVGIVGTWLETGLVTILLMAGMSRVPTALYEAARLDGAGPVREFFTVTLPGVRGEIAVALTLTTIAALKTFDLVYVTTSGGPGNSTSVPAYEVYHRAFQLGQVGSAAAVAVTLTVLILVVSLVVNQLAERKAA